MRRLALALVSVLVCPLAPGAAELDTSADITACMERNLPEPDSIRAVRMTTRDPRAGSKVITVVKLYGRRTDDGLRRLLVRFLEPEDVRGASLLLLEQQPGVETEIYITSPEFDGPRKISASGRSSKLFGTTFSYEDFERLNGFNLMQDSKRLPDEVVRERPVYVVESRPADSAYDRIVNYVDQESCLPLRMELYETGKRLRKQLTTNPKWNLQHGPVWVAHMVLMKDERDLTTTHLMVDSHEQDVLLPDGIFSVEGLKDAIRAEGASGTPAEGR